MQLGLTMQEFFQKHGVTLGIAIIPLIAAFSVLGYRVQVLEANDSNQIEQITTLNETATTVRGLQKQVDDQAQIIEETRDNTVELQISNAKMQSDLSYIIAKLNKLIP